MIHPSRTPNGLRPWTTAAATIGRAWHLRPLGTGLDSRGRPAYIPPRDHQDLPGQPCQVAPAEPAVYLGPMHAAPKEPAR